MDQDIKSRILHEIAQTPEALKKMQPDFLQNRLKEFEVMKSHQASKSYEDVRKAAHNWKGFCAPYGFKTLGDLASRLDQSIKDQGADSEIETIFREIEATLDAYKAHPDL